METDGAPLLEDRQERIDRNTEIVVAQDNQKGDGEARREGQECPGRRRRSFGRFLERAFKGGSGAKMRMFFLFFIFIFFIFTREHRGFVMGRDPSAREIER